MAEFSMNPMLLDLALRNPTMLASLAAEAGVEPPEPPAEDTPAPTEPAGPSVDDRLRQALSGFRAVQAPARIDAPVPRSPVARVPLPGRPAQTNLAVLANLLAPQRQVPPTVAALGPMFGR